MGKNVLRSLLQQKPLKFGKTVHKHSKDIRASAVACILRVHVASDVSMETFNLPECIDTVLLESHPKVSMLFIKRAVRAGDQWSGDSESLFISLVVFIFYDDCFYCLTQFYSRISRWPP